MRFSCPPKRTATNDLVTSLHFARSEAIKREAPTRLCPSDNWAAEVPVCSPLADVRDGWIVVANPDVDPEGLQTHEPLTDALTLSVDFGERLDFSATGAPEYPLGSDEINLLLCDQRGNRDMGGGIAAGRWINIRGPGRPRIYDQLVDVQSILGGC